MKLKLLILFTFLTFLSCREKDSSADIVDAKTYSYLALGDSYTIGQGVDPDERWPAQLKSELEKKDVIIDELKVIAQTGWTTANLQNAIEQENPGSYDMVSLLIGVNNQFQGLSFSEYQTEFDSLLNQAIAFAGGIENVIVVSIPDYGVTPFGANNSETIATELDNYNQYQLLKCEDIGVVYIDITGISRELADGENALAEDSLHPSAFQYSKWVEKILPFAEAILSE